MENFIFWCRQNRNNQRSKKDAINFKKSGDLEATISKPVSFESFICQDQVTSADLNDARKIKDHSWNHLFNNYGMNHIRREEFIFLLKRTK